MGIAHLALRPYTELSGGERQLVLIARALAQEPALLVMDEPTASLDFGNQIRVLDQIAALRARGMAVLLSTHQPEHALQVADRIALLGRGGLQACGAAAQVATPAALAALYGVSEAAVAARLPAIPKVWAGATSNTAAASRAGLHPEQALQQLLLAVDGRIGQQPGKPGSSVLHAERGGRLHQPLQLAAPGLGRGARSGFGQPALNRQPKALVQHGR